MNESDHKLKKNFLELKEWEAVLIKVDQFFQGVSLLIQTITIFQGIDDEAIQEIEQARETEQGIGLRSDKEPIGYVKIAYNELFVLSYTVGVIAREKVSAFERVLWRACRRTAFVRSADIDELLDNPDSVDFIINSNYFKCLI